jgi:hypothetical protein
MVRRSFASVLLVVVLSGSSAFAAGDSSRGTTRLRERDPAQPFLTKIIRVVKDLRRVVSNSFLLGDPRP